MHEDSLSIRPHNGKLALVLIAYHHGSGNIASQRFRGLLRHLPRSDHNVHVFSGPLSDISTPVSDEEHFFNAPLMSASSARAKIAILRRMLRSGRRKSTEIPGESWIASVASAATACIRAEKEAGNRVVVMASYSPIDALIVGRLVADELEVALVQDFRDGLVHENLGRKGALYIALRRILENWAVRPGAINTTVSRSLRDYFVESYPWCRTVLLYNGCDSAVDRYADNIQHQTARSEILLGHFGRIGKSDGGSSRTLHLLLDHLAAGSFAGTLEFFGELTSFEELEIRESMTPCRIYGHVPFNEAVERMKLMSSLLVITSDRASVATGKIFEYLFSGRRIVLATLRRNEAARLLEEIGDDDLVLDFSRPETLPSISEIEAHLQRPFERTWSKIERYQKSSQAVELAALLSAAAEGRNL